MVDFQEYDNIAQKAASDFKRRFPKLDFDEILQEARIVIFKALSVIDESRDKGEIGQFLKQRVEWRLRDYCRKSRGLRYKEKNKINYVSLDGKDGENGGTVELDYADHAEYEAKQRRQSFLDEVACRVEKKLALKKENRLIYKWFFVDGQTVDEVSEKTGVARRTVANKRQEFLDSMLTSLKDLML